MGNNGTWSVDWYKIVLDGVQSCVKEKREQQAMVATSASLHQKQRRSNNSERQLSVDEKEW